MLGGRDQQKHENQRTIRPLALPATRQKQDSTRRGRSYGGGEKRRTKEEAKKQSKTARTQAPKKGKNGQAENSAPVGQTFSGRKEKKKAPSGKRGNEEGGSSPG